MSRSRQLSMLSIDGAWEAGLHVICRDGEVCRMQPCTDAQGVECCARCAFRRTCGSACDKVVRRG